MGRFTQINKQPITRGIIIMSLTTKDQQALDKAEWMVSHPDEVDWNEVVKGLTGITDGGQYKDVIEGMPSRDEIAENLKIGK